MLSLAWKLIKLSALIALVLVAGIWIRWNGVTLSDHVKTGMAQAERRLEEPDARLARREAERAGRRGAKAAEDLMTSERQKLRDLLRELNTGRTESQGD
ncbi:MAG TPA: hypothetical protein VL588_08900 [Bdellovibrionota bacterium]|jgi:hypothetical protein|nr:hypothetical protein [Bdellovibrionota bacterium]